MPETPNHGYNVPSEGAQDWHVPLNENFKQYDTDIEIRATEDDRSNYEPKDGAKFFATDTQTVYLGDGSNWMRQRTTGKNPTFSSLEVVSGLTAASVTADEGVFHGLRVSGATRTEALGVGRSPERPVDVEGGNNWNLDDNDGDVRIGDDDYRLAIGVSLGGGGRGTARLRAKGGVEQLKLGAGASDTVNVQESSVTVNGDLDVSGNKNFAQAVDTPDGEREVVYTATEADTPRTETSGVAELDDGRAKVDLPDHFGWVTDDDEPLVVQTTPYGGTAGLKVVERSTDRLVVEALDGEGDYEFSYTVRGTREGHADKKVVREPTAQETVEGHLAPADD